MSHTHTNQQSYLYYSHITCEEKRPFYDRKQSENMNAVETINDNC